MFISLEKIAKILGQKTQSTLVCSHFTFNSRKIVPGSLFFALKGKTHDGHNFLEQVARDGAYGAVVDRSYDGPGYGLELFFVEDVTESLQSIAKQIVKDYEFRIIGVTGSVGKTSTKETIYEVLSKKYKVHATRGSENSQVSLPITILSARGDEDFLLLEMAMTESGHINVLSEIAPCEVVVMTPITYVHSKNFESLDGIAEAKAEIFSPENQFAVIHNASKDFDAVYKSCLCKSVNYPSKIPVISPYKQTHLSENFVAAYEVAKYCGMTDDQIRIASLALISKKVPHRFEVIKRDGITFVDDSYNANALSTTAALDNLPKPQEGGRTIFVFGEMTELGEMSKSSHQIVANKALEKADEVLCIGREAKLVSEAFSAAGKKGTYYYDFRSLKDGLYKTARPSDVVLIKGSNSLKLWHLLDKGTVGV